ncbi:MAG: GNAT family N-acetyltransferase [Promethearchaeota archaeon]
MTESQVHTFIRGEMIDLIPLNPTHTPLYSLWDNNPKVRKYDRNVFPLTIEESKNIFESDDSKIKTRIMFEIWYKKDQKPIGYCEIDDIFWIDRRAHLGLTIGDPEYWGRGIGTETIKLLTEYCFVELNFHKIAAEALAPNRGSQRCFEKNGFEYEGKLKEDTYIDGEFIDLLKFCILKDDWIKNVR